MRAPRPAGAILRVGLAGLGAMGRNHLRVLSSREDLPSRRDRRSRRGGARQPRPQTGAQAFAEPLAMIEEAELDALVIAAPTTAHVPLALAAIERGIPVLVEKPLAATVDEGVRIVDASRPGGVPVQVGHVERFNPAVLELGRLLRRAGSAASTRSRAAGRDRSRPGSATSG